jgi:hypothetical protein
MTEGTRYTVVQGECIETVAARFGHDPQTVWNHPDNEGLRETRTSPHVLAPGDQLVVPPVRLRTLALAADQMHRLKVQRPEARLVVRFLVDGEPRANVQYKLVYGETEVPGITDRDGVLDEPVPFDLTRATVRFAASRESPPRWRPEPFARVNDADLVHEGGDPHVENAAIEAERSKPPPEDVYEFVLRHLDPSATMTGIQARLRALGYDVGSIDGELGPRTVDGLRSFQVSAGRDPTGELDDATRAKLSQFMEG